MERMTYRHNGRACVHGADAENAQETAMAVAARLAAYEDTGLMPKEIERILDAYGRGMTLRSENAKRLRIIKDISTDRLRELARAERDGRVVQYVPGDIVCDRFGEAWTVRTTEIHRFDGTLRYLYRCGHPGTNDYRALYADEILAREEADTALEAQKGGGRRDT